LGIGIHHTSSILFVFYLGSPPVQLLKLSSSQIKSKVRSLTDPQYNVVYTLDSLGLAPSGQPAVPSMPNLPEELFEPDVLPHTLPRTPSSEHSEAAQTRSSQAVPMTAQLLYESLKAELPPDMFTRGSYESNLLGLESEGDVQVIKLHLHRLGGYEVAPVSIFISLSFPWFSFSNVAVLVAE
jgi:hypothetical protein